MPSLFELGLQKWPLRISLSSFFHLKNHSCLLILISFPTSGPAIPPLGDMKHTQDSRVQEWVIANDSGLIFFNLLYPSLSPLRPAGGAPRSDGKEMYRMVWLQ